MAEQKKQGFGGLEEKIREMAEEREREEQERKAKETGRSGGKRENPPSEEQSKTRK